MPSTSTDRLNGLTTSVAVKPPCITVATTNITLSGLQTISSVTVAEGDRVLVKGQATASENGIYTASTGSWIRAKDFDGNRDVVSGTRVLVRNTGINGVEYELTTANPIVIGTTSLTFALRYGANATYDQTEAEIAAGVTPINYAKWPSPWKDISRFVSDNTGVIDVSTQFANAIAAEKNIIIPEGTYLFDGATAEIICPDAIHIQGAGKWLSKIKLGPNVLASKAALRWSAFALGVYLQDFQIQVQNASKTQYGLRFAELRGSDIERVAILGPGTTGDDTRGILLDGTGTFTGGVTIKQCYISNHLRGVDLQGTCTDVMLTNNTFYGSTNHLTSHGIHVAVGCSGVSIDHNSLNIWNRPIYSEGTFLTQTGNRIENDTAHFEWVRGAGHARIWATSIGDKLIGAGTPIYPINDVDKCTVISGPGVADFDLVTINAERGMTEYLRTTLMGSWATPTYAAGSYTCNNGGTWTVQSGDVTNHQHSFVGKTLRFTIRLDATATSVASPTTLSIAVPAAAVKAAGGACFLDVGGTKEMGKWEIAAGTSLVVISRAADTAFGTVAITLWLQGEFEVS